MQSVYEPNRRIGTTRCPRTTRSANAIVGPVTTKAWLEGHLFDLAALADLLAVGDVRVVRDDGDDENRYYLTAPEIDNPSEPGRFDQPAELLIGRINGLARTRDASYRPVSLSGIYTSPHGQHVFPRRRRIRRTGAFIDAHARPPGDVQQPSHRFAASVEPQSSSKGSNEGSTRSKPPARQVWSLRDGVAAEQLRPYGPA